MSWSLGLTLDIIRTRGPSGEKNETRNGEEVVYFDF